VTIAFIRAGVTAFVSGGADCFGGFELDQLLHHQTHRVADQVHSVASAERVEKFGQGLAHPMVDLPKPTTPRDSYHPIGHSA